MTTAYPSSPQAGERRRGGVLLPTIIILAGIVIAFVVFTGFYTEFLWFDSVGKTQVFNIALFTRFIMFGVFALVMAVVSTLALIIAFRTRPAFVGATPEQASLERYRIAIEPYRKGLAVAIVGILSFFAGLAGSGEYGSFLLWQNSTLFGEVDPQFGLDFSFYMFELPFIRFVLGFAFAGRPEHSSWTAARTHAFPAADSSSRVGPTRPIAMRAVSSVRDHGDAPSTFFTRSLWCIRSCPCADMAEIAA